MIRVERVRKVYETERGDRDVHALEDIHLTVKQGEFVSLVGPSGCGKSTLLKIIAGLTISTSGTAEVAGCPVTGPRRDVGIMLQTPVLFPWRTVLSNVLLPAEVFGLDLQALRMNALELIRVVGLAGFERHYPRELSGGMQQRVVIVRTLLTDPKLVLMDEPFGALDEFTRESLNEEISRLIHERGQTVVLVTHNIQEAVFLADRVVVMTPSPGRIADTVPVDLPRPRVQAIFREPAFHEAVLSVRESLGRFI